MHRGNLLDVEVEMLEAKREPRYFHPKQLISSEAHPHVGASLGKSNTDAETGSLGGYMMIDSKLHALMTHQAMSGSERKEPFPRFDETIGSVRAVQPSHEDLVERIADLEYYMGEVDLGLYTGEDNEPRRAKLAKLKNLEGENSIFGTVVKSLGISF
jgi:hypothetical protein